MSPQLRPTADKAYENASVIAAKCFLLNGQQATGLRETSINLLDQSAPGRKVSLSKMSTNSVQTWLWVDHDRSLLNRELYFSKLND